MRLGTAIERLVDNYRYASDKEWIQDKVAWALYYTWKEADDRKTENSSEKPNICEHITEDGVTCAKYPACDDCLDNPLNKVKGSKRLVKGSDEPKTETEIAKAIVHKMIDDAVIAEDAYPDLRQRMHDAVERLDEYYPSENERSE